MNSDLTKKIALLDKLSGGTLSIAHYTHWELGSYRKGSLFCCVDGCIGHVCAMSFAECIDKACQFVEERIANE